MAKLKVAGTWAGVIEVELDIWTLPMLRQEVAKRSNLDPELINLICGGRILKDGDGAQTLTQLGVKDNAKILASRIAAADEGKSLMAEEERSRRLTRVKAAAAALSKRHADGSLPIEDYNIELEDQRGQKVQLGSETDQRAVMMGLMLHANAKSLIKRELFAEALEVLAMGEEAFSLCDPKVLEFVDNVPILQIDMVWCYFLLRDIKWLSVAGVRLEKAREGLERAHGKDFSRVRLLQGGQHPELALHLRLELLEGVVAYHSRQFDKARNALKSAQTKFLQLQIPDEALSMVMNMGFREEDAKRALRLNNQDVGSAVDFLIEERAKRAQKRKEDLQRQKEILEQKAYGVTPMKKAVDMQMLNRLALIGFARDLAAEALRRNENDFQKALDELTNPEINSKLQVYIESRKRKRQEKLLGLTVDQLVSMGFERSRAISALEAGGNREDIIQRLLSLSEANPEIASLFNTTLASTSNNNNNSNPNPDPENPASNTANGGGDDGSGNNAGESSSDSRDVEMEDQLADELANTDALSAYDIEVSREGEAISEYLAMFDSSQNCGTASSSSSS